MWTFSVSVSGGSNVGHQLCVSASCRRLSCLSVLLILKTGEGERAWARGFALSRCQVILKRVFLSHLIFASTHLM